MGSAAVFDVRVIQSFVTQNSPFLCLEHFDNLVPLKKHVKFVYFLKI